MIFHIHTRWLDFPMRIAADKDGIRALLLGGPSETLQELQLRFPKTLMTPEHLPLFDAVLALLDGRSIAMQQPLRPQGTPFQRSVWTALTNIPHGHTSTYAAVAASIGRPQAARAVATACAANPIAILIPCHRVIRGDGSLAGYRWGLKFKTKLLEWELQTRPPGSIKEYGKSHYSSGRGPIVLN